MACQPEQYGRTEYLMAANRCWHCGKKMSEQLRAITPFCSEKCEREYNQEAN